MVVGLFGADFPFVDGSASAFGADEVLGGDLLGEHTVLVGTLINTASLYLQRATAAKVPQPVCWPGVGRIFEVGKMQPATTRSRPPEHRFGSHFPCTGRFVITHLQNSLRQQCRVPGTGTYQPCFAPRWKLSGDCCDRKNVRPN